MKIIRGILQFNNNYVILLQGVHQNSNLKMTLNWNMHIHAFLELFFTGWDRNFRLGAGVESSVNCP